MVKLCGRIDKTSREKYVKYEIYPITIGQVTNKYTVMYDFIY